MSLKLLALHFASFMSKKGYEVIFNTKIFNPLSKDILYTNSGIAGIYEKFSNSEILKNSNIATIQTCLRVDGKHNDIEEVGNSLNHMCCFQMLGVFSLRNACVVTCIKNIFSFLDELLGGKNLSVTIHPDDEYLKNEWDMISPGIKIDIDEANIWKMSDNEGFFGTCTEIYYKGLEIWNIVIITSEMRNGVVYKLNNIMVDTGGGLERIYMCKNNLQSIFDIPEYKKVIDFIIREFFVPKDKAKIILDHLKAADSIINSGIPLANSKRGYVLKKFVRKIVYILNRFNILVNSLISICSYIFINSDKLLVLLESELEMVKTCLHRFDRLTKECKMLTAKEIFILQDTHGIHNDITLELCKEKGIDVDIEGLNLLKNSSAEKGINVKIINSNVVQTDLKYDLNELTIDDYEILINNVLTLSIEEGSEIEFISSKTIFYPEMGGQKNDLGTIGYELNGSYVDLFDITYVYKSNDLIVCRGKCMKSYDFNIKTNLILKPNLARRKALSMAHSSHHILNNILSKICIGKNVQVSSCIDVLESKISLFNYSNQDFTIEQLNTSISNLFFDNKLKLDVNIENFEDAVNKNSLYLPFENYPSVVRVISITDKKGLLNSVEICAGTHYVKEIKGILVTKIQKKNRFVTTYKFKILNN